MNLVAELVQYEVGDSGGPVRLVVGPTSLAELLQKNKVRRGGRQSPGRRPVEGSGQ